ncbi:hypothetical protein [Bacillus sp. 1NLA3E]|uniref:hypothetical protein n=1 Tax=Bacillus sp. 1NLA3E TaxID=666686 RepID=UPI000247E3AA|nr:hypothetical protein [Bacillus sp. 1NLA3E]AGK52606.1 protein YhjD [Bacillus sp. 1NLA3E]
MTRIPEEERDLLEKAIYLPMVITILNRDLTIIDKSPFKLKKPYLILVEETLKVIQREMADVKRLMKQKQLKVEEIHRDDAFTMFMFLYKGFEEHHNYFNPRIRNKVQELLEFYLYRRHLPQPSS